MTKIVVEKLRLEQVTALLRHFEHRDRARLMAVDHLVAALHQAAASADPAKAGPEAIATWVATNNQVTEMSDAEVDRIVSGREASDTLN